MSMGIPKIGRLLGPRLPKDDKVTQKKVDAYDVYVKRKQLKKGKGNYLTRGYQKANIKPLSHERAYNLGATTVDKFTNRSFFLKSSKSKVPISDFKAPKYITEKFRKKKGDKRIFVEKTKFAIDSYQEKQGIPYESVRLRKAGLLDIKPQRRKKGQKKKGFSALDLL